MRTPIRLPGAVRNPVSLLGMAIATAMAVVFVVLLLLDLAGALLSPYIGLLIFVAVPAAFVAGLLLVPLGAWWTARRRRAAAPVPEWPVIDLRQPRPRSVFLAVFALTIVNVVIVSLAAYGGVHHMESTAFCTQTCHTAMEPQAAAHAVWPHAGVSCTQCHVGPGAGASVEGKLAGTRQLAMVIANRVPTPIPSPDRLLQPTQVTCGGCHAVGRGLPQGDRLRVMREYASDESTTETVTAMRLRVEAIHRHVALEIDYPADERAADTMSWIRARSADGTVREFAAPGASGPGDRALRRMDCLDCHNRAAHTFSSTPERAVDAAIGQGRIPRELPFIRQQALAAVTADYPDRTRALEAIANALEGYYASRPSADARLLSRAIAGTQEVWARNVFPAMRVTWGTYPSQLGHLDAPGCFRCHDDSHTAADGRAIAQDCELCHTLPE